MSERNARSPLTFAFALALGAIVSTLACGSTTAPPTFTPQTGIVVRSESLTSGIGCGTGSTQIFKYVAVAVDANHQASTAGVYDCFADGVLVNLQPTEIDTGFSLDYTVYIYAFNKTAYTASQAKVAAAAAQPNDSATVPKFNQSAFDGLSPTYTTSCTATEQGNIQVVAVCAMLAASVSSATVSAM